MPATRRLGQSLSAEGATTHCPARGLLTALGAVLVLGVILAGCAKDISRHPIQQFEPAPPVTLGAEDVLAPVCGRTIAEALRESDQEYRSANAAQKAGDSEGAMKHYTRMLEVLIAADLDPAAF